MSQWVWLVPVAMVLWLPSAVAGTLENPEVSDPPGDVAYMGAAVPELPFRDQVDILSFHVERIDPHRLEMHLRVLSIDPIDKHAPQKTDVPPRLFWTVDFETYRGRFALEARYDDSGWAFSMREPRGSGAVPGRIDSARDTITWNVPSANMSYTDQDLNLTKFRVRADSSQPFFFGDAATDPQAAYVETPTRKIPSPGPRPQPREAPGPEAALLLLGALLLAGRRK